MKVVDHYTSSMHVSVRYHIYQPKVVLRIKGVVQIHHGRGGHADLYEPFARYLLENGFVVVVSDFVGHGQSLIDFEQGYFGNEKGIENLVKDVAKLQSIIRGRYDDAPYFIMGFDLGSLVVRKYISEYGDFIEGALLLSTIAKVEYEWIKRKYFDFMNWFKGPTYKSDSYAKILGASKERFKEQFFTNDENEYEKYVNDPMRNFVYTTQGYRDFLSLVHDVNSESVISKTPSYLSLYIASGANDPLSLEVDQLVEKYKKHSIRDLTYTVFDESKHSLIFEKNKKQVYKDILKWLNERTYM